MKIRYVGLPKDPRTGEARKTFLYRADHRTKVRQVLWGDWLRIDGESGGWAKVLWGARDNPETVFIPSDHIVERRPMEIIFLDVGQGDGAILITPEAQAEEDVIVIDAGERWNMAHYLGRRFRYRDYKFTAAVITHPDKDHYYGFRDVFSNHQFGFDTVYHSGLAERPVSGDWQKFGGKVRDAASGLDYLTGLPVDDAAFRALFSDGPRINDFDYPSVMNAAVNNPNVKKFAMLSNAHGTMEDGRCYMPGFAPSDGRGYAIEALGPVAEFDAAGDPRLRVIKYVNPETGRLNTAGYSEVKNGHSVLLRLHYGKCRVLFGGDLNRAAEQFLLTHYGEMPAWPDDAVEATAMIAKARTRLRSEVMKVCHHGSSDVTDEFLTAVDAEAFVISSGDEKGHIHPRPDLLGRLGKLGRGERPVLLSTELQRATREKEDEDIAIGIAVDINRLMENPDDALRDDIVSRVMDLGGSNVTRYGAIHLKTDGEDLITAFRTEQDEETDKWFFYQYRLAADGTLSGVDGD